MFKHVLFAAIATVMIGSTQAKAQEFQMRDGQRTILIDLNSAETNQEARIQRLERAVRDLQHKVWQIGTQPVSRDLYVCTLSPFMDRFESGKHSLQYDAERDVRSKCEAENNSMHCNKPVCRKIN